MFNFGKCYKYLDMVNHGFWDIKKILTYGRPAMIVTGSRSVGKSTQVALLCLLTYTIYGKKFAYIRRRPIDVQKTYKTFFNNAVEIYNRYLPLKKIVGFKAFKGSYWIAFSLDDDEEPVWEECGSYIALSQEENYKSNSFSDYVIMIYDEFISKDKNKYMGTKENTDAEWDAMMSLYQTIDRGIDEPFRNETVIFCLGNKSTVYNPIALSLGLVDYVTKGARFTNPKGKQWVWEDIDGVEATVNYEDSYAYQLSTERTKEYAYENKGEDTEEFIKRPEVAKYYMTVRFKGNDYGIYYDKESNWYIDKPKDWYSCISLDVASHRKTDVQLIKKWTNDYTMMELSQAYAEGRLYFGSGKIQALFLRYLEFTQ